MDYRGMAVEAANKYGLDPNIFLAQVEQESGFNPNAVSHVGAQGLTQIMPATAAQPGFGVAPFEGDVFDPAANLDFGARYMKAMVDRYDGDYERGLAAYNAGAGTVDKAGGIPNIEETQNYVRTIMNNSSGGSTATSVPNPPIVEERDLNGFLTNDGLSSLVDGALQTSQPSPQYNGTDGGDADTPVMMATRNAPLGGYTVPTSHEPDGLSPLQSYEWQKGAGLMTNLKGKWQGLDPEYRSQALLAMGTGLLAGPSMSEGLALGFKGIQGAQQGILNRHHQLERDEMQHARNLEIQRIRAGSVKPKAFQAVGSVLDQHGNEQGGVVFNPNTGQYGQIQNNQFIALEGNVTPLNRSTAAGDKAVSASQMTKLTEKLDTARGTLRSIDNVLVDLDNLPYGIDGMKSDISTFVKTLSGRTGLSEEEIKLKAARGELQSLIGNAREDVVGPGVMTEQDALRVLAALGGDLSAMTHPDVVRARLTEIRDRTSQRYDRDFDQYNKFRAVPGFDVYQERQKYESPQRETKETSTPQQDVPPLPVNIPGLTPELWSVMTPEERAAFQ